MCYPTRWFRHMLVKNLCIIIKEVGQWRRMQNQRRDSLVRDHCDTNQLDAAYYP
ncbi:hypothetical protein BC628DRAFT_1376507, partial [Trametes gibbosa]